MRWGGPAVRVDDVIDVDEAIGALKTYNFHMQHLEVLHSRRGKGTSD